MSEAYSRGELMASPQEGEGGVKINIIRRAFVVGCEVSCSMVVISFVSTYYYPVHHNLILNYFCEIGNNNEVVSVRGVNSFKSVNGNGRSCPLILSTLTLLVLFYDENVGVRSSGIGSSNGNVVDGAMGQWGNGSEFWYGQLQVKKQNDKWVGICLVNQQQKYKYEEESGGKNMALSDAKCGVCTLITASMGIIGTWFLE